MSRRWLAVVLLASVATPLVGHMAASSGRVVAHTSTTAPETWRRPTHALALRQPVPKQAHRRLRPPTNTVLLKPLAVPTSTLALHVLGEIDIDAIGLHQPLFEGVARNVIDAGPAHWQGTALPGGFGNVVVAGHRTTHTHPFLDVAKLRVGDRIVFRMLSGWTFVYAVTTQFVVADTAMWIADQHPGHQVTLFTCHPIGSSRQRLVTRGRLVAAIAPAS